MNPAPRTCALPECGKVFQPVRSGHTLDGLTMFCSPRCCGRFNLLRDAELGRAALRLKRAKQRSRSGTAPPPTWTIEDRMRGERAQAAAAAKRRATPCTTTIPEGTDDPARSGRNVAGQGVPVSRGGISW